jgi:hypothetical protein
MFHDEMDNDSFIFNDNGDSELEEFKKRLGAVDCSPNNLTIEEDNTAIDNRKYQHKGDPLNTVPQFNFKNVLTERSRPVSSNKPL